MRDVLLFCFKLTGSLLAWIIIAPIAAVVRKNRSWVAVIGRHDGRFLDNTKYFFLQASQINPALRIVFVTEHQTVFDLIGRHAGLECITYPTLRAFFFLSRCSAVIVDDHTWFGHFRAFFLIRAKVVQLWHGAGFKWAEIGHWRREKGKIAWASHPFFIFIRIRLYRITRRYICYAAMTATSRFYRDQAFKLIFKADHFLVTGYPRNDFVRSLLGSHRDAAWANTDRRIAGQLLGWQQQGRKIVLVAPTFRHSGTLPMAVDADILARLDAFAMKHGIEFLFKFHPAERNADYLSGEHFHVLTRDSDIYPLFPYLSALVTDYSSIAMDFLLVDRPILLLIPEDDDYVEKDRGLQFDPREMIPGRVVTDWRSLMPALLQEWKEDSRVNERAAMRRKVFDDLPQSGAVPRIIAFMREQKWIRP
jgi:CDP-glycerol glycerophosphotransferase (TagB/SpsB family)